MDVRTDQIGSREQRIVLRSLAEAVARPGCKLLEIGSWCGDSAVILGKVASQNDGHLFCVDWWKGSVETDLKEIAGARDVFAVFWRRMCREGLEDTVVPIRTASDVAAQTLRQGQFDLIFIDGDHRYDQVAADIRNYGPLVRPAGGILCGHDCEGRVGDFDRGLLKAGRNDDFHQGLHCGVILAVDGAFEEYSVNYSIWSVRTAGEAGRWVPTNPTFDQLDGDGEIPPLLLEKYKDFNLVRFRGRVHAVAQWLGTMDIATANMQVLQQWKDEGLIKTASSVEGAKQWVDECAIVPPLFLEAYKDCNIVRYRGLIYAIAHRAGSMDLAALDERTLRRLKREQLLAIVPSVEQAREWVDERCE